MFGRSVGNLPASFARRDVPGWLAASSVVGLAAGVFALWAVWRPLSFLPAPTGTLGEHAAFWAKLAVHRALPFAFEESSTRYARWWRALDADGRAGIELRVGLSALAVLTPFGLFAKPCLKARDQFLFVRGARRHEGKEATRRLRALSRRVAARQPEHNLAPKVPWPSTMWTRHTLLVGGVGSGKSTVLRPLIRKIVEADERLFLFDPKGEFTSAFGTPAIVAPWDARSYAWDIAKDLRNLADMRRFARSTVEASDDPMWSNAARQLLVGLLVHLRKTQRNGWGWRDLSRLVSLPQPALLAIMSNCHPEAVRAVEHASVTTTGVLINLSAFCSSIHDLAQAWGDVPPERRVSVVAWARGAGARQLILQGHEGYSHLTKCYVEGMAGVFAALINSAEFGDDLTQKIWFVADEFAQAGKLPVRSLFEVGRSRGVRCVVACQDFAQLDEVYGEKFVKALLSMCGTLVVGQVMPGETADSLCKVFGTREVERPNVSETQSAQPGSSTLSYSREEIALYKPSELASRLGLTDDGKGVRMIVFVGGETHEIVWPICALPVVRPGHEPADWTIDHEDAQLQSTLREASGKDDLGSAVWINEMREKWLRERLRWLPPALREAFIHSRRAVLRAASRAAAILCRSPR